MRIILVSLLLCGQLIALTQSNIATELAERINNHEAHVFELLTPIQTDSRHQELYNYVNEFAIYTLNDRVFNDIINQRPEVLSTQINLGEKTFNLELYKETSNDVYQVNTSDGRSFGSAQFDQVFYRGLVNQNENSIASISIFKNDIKIFLADQDGNYTISAIDNGSEFIFYNDQSLKIENTFECHNTDIHNVKSNDTNTSQRNSTNDCVPIHFTVDYALYQSLDSELDSVVNYVSAVFNEVATIYANESINISLAEILVFTSPDPYENITDMSELLNTYGSTTADNYEGRLAHLLSSRSLGGGMAWTDVLCAFFNPNYTWGPYGVVTGLYNYVAPFQTYTWNVGGIAHEIGHNFGSQHTHKCVWGPNNDSALDDCYTTQGSCDPGPTPTNGGTVMSYCHITSHGINLVNGFGQEPGDLIRNNYFSASCDLGCSNEILNEIRVLELSPVFYCSDTLSLNLTLANQGHNYIDSVVLETITGDSVLSSQIYYCNIEPGFTEFIQMEYSGIEDDLSSICIQALLPNGASDPDTTNNFLCEILTVDESCNYCTSSANSSNDEWISEVQFGDFSYASSSGEGYQDFSNMVIDMLKGDSIDFEITPSFSIIPFLEYYRIWIDFNQDNDFDDSNELVFSTDPTDAISISNSFLIPEDALLGHTKLRIAMKYNDNTGIPESCDHYQYGEVEDYTANILAPSPSEGSDEDPCEASFSFTGDQISGDYIASNIIFSNSEIDTSDIVMYNAPNIELNNGFEVKIGGSFTTQSAGCN